MVGCVVGCYGGMGDGVLSGWKGGWCVMGIMIFKEVLTQLKYEHQNTFPLSINHDKVKMKEFLKNVKVKYRCISC